MRILMQECKKMLSVRLLLLLALFTVLFYNMFFELNLYPAGGQCTDSPYDMPYAATLIKKYGPTLPVTEKGKIEKEVRNMKKQVTEMIQDNEALKKAGISDFDTMIKERARLADHTDESVKKWRILYLADGYEQNADNDIDLLCRTSGCLSCERTDTRCNATL